ncbi:MAG TPA: CDP-alcohol phosphatidyltransferase family protein [Candidatus Thermoplasmatota archaeon]|nr:CDP-alcohol phosphatidyltransferase family protein [Candidatus Thermoplasmatota archaeon]
MTPVWKRQLPNALSYARFALTAATFAVVLAGDKALYVVLVLLAVVTDLLDGPLARRWGVEDARGANLDSLSDYAFYLSLLVWTFLWAPEYILARWPLAAVFAVAYTSINLASMIARGLIGYHNRYTRLAATYGVVLALWIAVVGPDDIALAGLVAILVLDLAQRTWRLLAHVRARRIAGAGRQA